MDTVAVKILQLPLIPNAFSPNGDGINDTWEIKYLNSYTDCTVEVFSRAGQLIFRSVGYSASWNGTFHGSPVPIGTYYYLINPKMGRKPIAGSVTIVR
jgi:gliding motility-associated-like protein